MPNFFQKLFRRNKELEDESLFHLEDNDKRERKKKSKSLFHRDKKQTHSSSDNDGFGRHVETTSKTKKSPVANSQVINDAASKRKRGEKNVDQAPSPNRLAHSYHNHPFAASNTKADEMRVNNSTKAEPKKTTQRKQEVVQDRRDTENSTFASNNVFATNFADFDNRESKWANQDKVAVNSNKSAPSSLSYQTLQQFEQQWTPSQAVNSKHTNTLSTSSLNDPFKPAHQKQIQLQRLPNGQLVIQPPPSNAVQVSNVNSKRNSVVPPPPPPPPMSPARMAAMSPSAQSDFCLSTDVDDDEYNRLRKEAARNLSPMLDKATGSDDDEEDEYSDEDDFYKITKNSYLPASTTSAHGKHGDKYMNVHATATTNAVATSKNVGIMGFPQDSYSIPHKGGRSSQYISDSENERDLFSPKNNTHSISYGGRGPQQNIKLNHAPAHRNPSISGGAASNNNDYFSDSENEVDSSNQQPSRFVFDSGFDDALVSNNTKASDNGHTGNRPQSPPTGPERIRSKQQYPILQSSSREKLSPSKMGASMQQQSLQKRQGVNGTKVSSASLYPDSSDSEDVVFAQMQGHLSKSTKAPVTESRSYGNTVQVKSQSLVGRPSSLSQPSPQEQIFSRSKGMERNAVENFPPSENARSDINNRSSRSLADQSPVLDLIAQAKADRQRRLESSSVGGAPSLTAKYLREHHNTKSALNTARQEPSHGNYPKTNNDTKALDKLSAKISGDKSDSDSVDGNSDKNDAWLFDEVAGALGPRGIAADLESLGGKSNRSRHSIRSHKSKTTTGTPKRGSGLPTDEQSVGSKHSRASRYSAKSSKSHFSHMSEQSRSVANDLIRLEMQLAMVGSNGMAEIKKLRSNGSVTGETKSILSSQSSRRSIPSGALKALKKTVIAPAGKLGIILANRTDSKGTVVSGVRTSSALFEKIVPGDRIVEIDGEDVSMMSVSEVTSIMARKNDFERVLTIISLPNPS